LQAASPFGAQTREYVLLRLILVTGLRPSEALALRWRNIDLTPGDSVLTIDSTIYRGVLRPYSKTSKEGEVQRLHLEELAAQVLTEWSAACLKETGNVDPDAFVFHDSEGGFLHVGNYLHRVLQPLARQAGIKTPLTFQMLRRTVGTWAAELGSMKDTQSILRHKTMKVTTDTYVQVITQSVRKTTRKLGRAMAAKRKKNN
jgi:integrase